MPSTQDASHVTPNPNHRPVNDMVSNSPTRTSSDTPHISLITVNLDVQNRIILFLPTPDLSTLMRTCKHFLDVCLLPLCALARIILYECDFRRVPSFRRFLRIHAGPSSRAHLIKDLWIAVSDSKLSVEFDTVEMLRNADEWSPAFLDILRHCHNLQRLRIDRWFMGEVPFSLLITIVTSSMHLLEDLSICMPDEADVDVLGRLTLLPTLRRLSFLRRDGFDDSFASLTPISLECLPRSLTELDIDLGAPINTPFPLVRKLGVRGTRLPIPTFVADATTAFPNVTELILRRHGVGHLYFTMPGIVEGARPLSKLEWRKRSSQHGDSAWPSLSTVWAEDLCLLYCLGFSKHLSSISIPFRRRSEERYFAPLLADASPKFLELRVNVDDAFLTFSNDWGSYFGPSVSSVVRLTMLHHTERNHSVKFWNGDLERAVLDDLCRMLPAFTSLAYLRIRFVPRYTPLRLELLEGRDIRAIANLIQKRYIVRLAQASRSLRCIALEVYDLGLECWEVSRVSEGQGAQSGPVCQYTKMSELAGWAILKREGMDVFKDVRPSLDIIR